MWMLFVTKWPHTRWTPAQPQRPVARPHLHIALQESSLVAPCTAHLGAPSTGQQWNPCSSEASGAHHPPPLYPRNPWILSCDHCPGERAKVLGCCFCCGGHPLWVEAKPAFCCEEEGQEGSHYKAGFGKQTLQGANGRSNDPALRKRRHPAGSLDPWMSKQRKLLYTTTYHRPFWNIPFLNWVPGELPDLDRFRGQKGKVSLVSNFHKPGAKRGHSSSVRTRQALNSRIDGPEIGQLFSLPHFLSVGAYKGCDLII